MSTSTIKGQSCIPKTFAALLLVALIVINTFTMQAQNCCIAPVQTFSSNLTQHSAKLNWSYFPIANCPDPIKFQVRYKPVNAATWVSANIPWTNTNTFSYNAVGLLSGKTYTWQVRTVCHNVFGYTIMSQWTSSQSFATLRVGNEISEDIPAMQLYPNPATNDIIIAAPASVGNDVQYRILDLMGKSLITLHLVASEEIVSRRIDINSLPAGLYVMEITVNNVKNLVRFVKD